MLGWGASLEEAIASPSKKRRGEAVPEEKPADIVPPPRRKDLEYLNSQTSFHDAHAYEYPGAVALDSSAILPDDRAEFGLKALRTLLSREIEEVAAEEESPSGFEEADDGSSGHFGLKSAPSADIEGFVREYERQANGSG